MATRFLVVDRNNRLQGAGLSPIAARLLQGTRPNWQFPRSPSVTSKTLLRLLSQSGELHGVTRRRK